MSEYLATFRCWPGFSGSFPFEQFDKLPDAELPAALGAYANDRLDSAEVGAMIEQHRKNRKGKAQRQARRRLGGDRADSGTAIADRPLPPICRLGRILGWWRPAVVGMDGPGARVAFVEAPSREFADALLGELERRRSLDFDEHKPEFFANPRFAVESIDSLPPGELASLRRHIAAIQAGREPPVERAELALLIGQRAFRVAEELAAGWPVDETDPPSPVAPDAFFWRGVLHDGLKPTPWRLLNTLWHAKHRRRCIRDLGEPVWQDHACEPQDDGEEVKSAIKAVNAFFKAKRIPFRVSKSGGYILLNPTDTK